LTFVSVRVQRNQPLSATAIGELRFVAGALRSPLMKQIGCFPRQQLALCSLGQAVAGVRQLAAGG
jgi:hypothetical protein